MTALAIISAVIILIALLRIRVTAEYSEEGFEVTSRIGPFKLLGRERRKAKIKKKRKEKRKEIRAGGKAAFMDILNAVKKTLSRLRRKLLIKQLTLHYTAAGEDPVKTAMYYGSANAAFGIIIPVLEENFRIRRRELSASADFGADKPGIYAKVIISMAVWEAIYVLTALLPVLLPSGADHTKINQTAGKEVRENG